MIKLLKITSYILLSMIFFKSIAQTDSAKTGLTFSGYMEAYYSYDLGNPNNHNKPHFMASHHRHDEVNLNLGFIKASYQKENIRGNFALMTGTYANKNLASEAGVLKNIFEANIGVRISKQKQLWLDAGVFASHIGFESAIGKDCWTLTRSILADNSPYYESGVKIGYTSDNKKWFLSLLYLNGWQRIQKPDQFNTPAFGHQLTFTPHEKITLNSSSFVGSDTPDSTNRIRYFHNFYSIIQLSPKIGLTAGFDIGMQQKNKNSTIYHVWYSPVLILKLKMNDKFTIVTRGEYYNDENEVIVNTSTTHGFQTIGYSLNLDYTVMKQALIRIEGKRLESSDKIFILHKKSSNENYCFTTALLLSF